MALKQKAGPPRPERLAVKANLKLNLGNFESLDIEVYEEYPVPKTGSVPALKTEIAKAVRASLRDGVLTVLEGTDIPVTGPKPAGAVAMHFMEIDR